MIKVTIDWQGQKGLENLIRYIENNLVYGEAQEKVRVLGHHTADYMKDVIKQIEAHWMNNSKQEGLKPPIQHGDHPELDESKLLGPKETQQYQMLIGVVN